MGVASKLVPYVLQAIQLVHRLVYMIPLFGKLFNFFTSGLANFSTCYAGFWAPKGVESFPRPKKPLKIFAFVGCPFCRKADMVISALGLDVTVYSCPRFTFTKYGAAGKESRYRDDALKIGGKVQFPLLVDENNGVVMYESSDIIAYLLEKYGNKTSLPLSTRIGLGNLIGNFFRSLFRPLPEHGVLRMPSKVSKQMLVLWGVEGSNGTLIAREALCSLEACYEYRTVPSGFSSKRKEYQKVLGSASSLFGFQPILEDKENAKIVIGGEKIVKYLLDTYRTGEVVKESWMNYSTEGAQKGHMTLG